MFAPLIDRGAPWMKVKAAVALGAILIPLIAITGAEVASGSGCGSEPGLRYVAVAANPAAALAGCRVLERGGTAADAAVAIQAVLTVVEPQASGFGGGSLVTYYDKVSDEVHVFDGLSSSGHAVTAGLTVPTQEEAARAGIAQFDNSVNYSARAVGVPGTAAVLGSLHQRFGKKHWETLFDDSISMAVEGFPLAPYTAKILAKDAKTPMCSYPGLRRIYCDGDKAKRAGDTVRNTELAELLRDVRDGGADSFYKPDGTIAPALVRELASGELRPVADASGPAVIPSLLTLDDFANYRSLERTPLCVTTFGSRLCTTPAPSTGGTTLANLMRIAEQNGIAATRPDTADYAHLLIEASRVAGTDARAYIGDPEFDGEPPADLTSADFVDSRAAVISPDKALHPVVPGDAGHLAGDTSTISAPANDETSQIAIVDRWGSALSMTTTVNLNFGSRVLARGLVLNNANTNYSAANAGLNAMQAGKRPRTSMAPTIVFDAQNHVSLVVGSAGGGPIPDYIAQVVLGVQVYAETPQESLARPHFSGQTPVADCAGEEDPGTDLEARTAAEDLLPALIERGAPCARAITLQSGAAAIQQLETGELIGAADPRRDGAAIGGTTRETG